MKFRESRLRECGFIINEVHKTAKEIPFSKLEIGSFFVTESNCFFGVRTISTSTNDNYVPYYNDTTTISPNPSYKDAKDELCLKISDSEYWIMGGVLITETKIDFTVIPVKVNMDINEVCPDDLKKKYTMTSLGYSDDLSWSVKENPKYKITKEDDENIKVGRLYTVQQTVFSGMQLCLLMEHTDTSGKWAIRLWHFNSRGIIEYVPSGSEGKHCTTWVLKNHKLPDRDDIVDINSPLLLTPVNVIFNIELMYE